MEQTSARGAHVIHVPGGVGTKLAVMLMYMQHDT